MYYTVAISTDKDAQKEIGELLKNLGDFATVEDLDRSLQEKELRLSTLVDSLAEHEEKVNCPQVIDWVLSNTYYVCLCVKLSGFKPDQNVLKTSLKKSTI